MESLILQRVIQAIKELKLTDNQFSKRIGVAQTTMSGYLSGNRKLSLQVIESMLNSFENISAEWLLRGEGEMYKTVSDNKNNNFDASQYVSKDKYESTVYLLAEVTNNLKETVLETKKLYEEINELRSQLKQPNLLKQKGVSFCSKQTNLIPMNIDDTLTQIFTDLKIIGKIQKENLLNNLGVESNMKLYSHKLDSLRAPNETHLKLIVCNGKPTSKFFLI